ncbi:MAG: hypothetical protein FJZ49_06960 [Candidatus Verstraetearchaeota archaeon]|nr:hypothetical protein [Candidatus Verstraetearchaeota archaeon]
MRKATQVVMESCGESLQACEDLASSLRSVRGLLGRHEQRRSYKHLKSIGTALVLTPTPEPLSDIVGLALIGIAAGAEQRKPPLTVCEMGEESRSILKGIRSSLPLPGRSWL